MSKYPLGIGGAIREWRFRRRRVFDLTVRSHCDGEWPEEPPRRTAKLFHEEAFTGPATGPLLCYRRRLQLTEDPQTLFGSVDRTLFGGRGAVPRGPVGEGLFDTVQAVSEDVARAPLVSNAQITNEPVPAVEFLHAAAMVRPDGVGAVMVRAMLAEPADEVFIWVLAHNQEPEQEVTDHVTSYLRDRGLKVSKQFIEYIRLPYMHPIGDLPQVFDLSIRSTRRQATRR
ncbi:hypothetical protein [Curtobacterium oceanosedimentum]|uniref:hypothetical protein n=1 Tax=Curtobacterium oceanosedimentum TaxID=465820 RepID=UPI003391AD12